jgi:DNA-binding FadR family transcriptional regulator
MHRRIYKAIKARDRQAAQAAMAEHLEAARHAQTLETPERDSD